MPVDAAGMFWMVGALVGVVICSVMVLDAIALTRAVRTDTERFIAWGDLVQWGAGLAIKLALVFIGIWLIRRSSTTQIALIVGGVVIWVMDFRDIVLVALKRQLRAVLRQEAKERAEHDA